MTRRTNDRESTEQQTPEEVHSHIVRAFRSQRIRIVTENAEVEGVPYPVTYSGSHLAAHLYPTADDDADEEALASAYIHAPIDDSEDGYADVVLDKDEFAIRRVEKVSEV